MKEIGLEWQVIDSPIQLKEQSSTPATPKANKLKLYGKDSSGVTKLYYIGEDGVEVGPLAANAITGSGTTNRLAYWSAATVLAANAVLTSGRVVFSDSNGLPTDDSSFNWDSSNHRLGIGTSSPSTSLHIVTASDNGCILDRYQNNGGAPNGGFDIRGGRGTIASPSAVANNDSLAGFRAYGYGTSFGGTADGALFVKAGEAFSGSAHGTYITLETTPTGSTTRAERFRVGPSGQWGIGGATFGTANNIFKSGGASAAPSWGTVNILDSDSHGDTLTGTVVRGDLIIGNSTPKWSRLARGSSGAFLRNDGSDVQWSTLILPNSATANRIVYATSSNTLGESANLAFDGTDFLLGSGIRARMASQNRFRHLQSTCSVFKSTSQSITRNTWTTVTFDSEVYDSDTLHDTSTNNSRITVPIAGYWLVWANAHLDTTGTTTPSLVGGRVIKNGVATALAQGIAIVTAAAGAGDVDTIVDVVGIISLAANDYVELQIIGNTAANNPTVGTATRYGAIYVGE